MSRTARGSDGRARRSVRLSGIFDPLEVTTRLAVAAPLDAHVIYEQPGRWWYAGGIRGSVTVRRDALDVCWEGADLDPIAIEGHPIASLQTAVDRIPEPAWAAYGWLSFDLVQVHAGHLEPSPDQPLGQLVVPDVEVEVTASDIRIDGPAQLVDQILDIVHQPPPSSPPHDDVRPVEVTTPVPESYREAVEAAVGRIRNGELEKVILSRPLRVRFPVDFPATYARGRRVHTPARSFLLDLPGLQAAGFSPETVAEVDAEGWVATQPLAGTRRRRDDPRDDARLIEELTTDPKEIYEHAVSVRLADQELRTLCDPTTVVIEEFMTVKSRGSVHHLGSRARGRLLTGSTCWDALAVLMPAVTASGIPKVPAYRVIADSEETPRGLYSGAVLRATHHGTLDAALALRTVYTDRGSTWLRAGAGIVAASHSKREYEETCEKLLSVAPYLVQQTCSPTVGPVEMDQSSSIESLSNDGDGSSRSRP